MEERKRIWKAILESVDKVREMGLTPIYAANYGSHNYNLNIDNDEYHSDIDIKVITLPTLKELVNDSKPVSTTIEISTGQCDIKDIRAFVPTLLKANIQFLETLCAQVQWVDTDYVEDFRFFWENLDLLIAESKPQLLKSIYGMCLEKQKALCHPYPTIKWKIDKWGYDGKQLHHIIRLFNFIIEYFDNKKPFKEAIWYEDGQIRDSLIDVKLNKWSLEMAKETADFYCNAIKEKVDSLLLKYETQSLIKEEYKNKANEIIINNIKKKILEGKE